MSRPSERCAPITPERFWAKVDKNGPAPTHRPDLGPCWLWQASKFKGGYGQQWWSDKNNYAHRVAWRLTHGAFPSADLELDHLCRVRHCVNPSHLEPVSKMENVKRTTFLTAANPRNRLGERETCAKGHRYDENDNLRWAVKGQVRYRTCRTCRNDVARRAAARRKAPNTLT